MSAFKRKRADGVSNASKDRQYHRRRVRAARPFRGGAARRFKTPDQRIDEIAARVFGFAITPHLRVVVPPTQDLSTFAIENAITAFDDNGHPIFARPEHEFEIVKDNGLYVDIVWKVNSKRNTFLRGAIQTAHTISLYKLALNILEKLRHRRRSHDDIRSSATLLSGREHKNGQMYLNGTLDGRKVVLKTSHHHKTQLTYILEAVIHLLLMCKTPSYVPELMRVSIDTSDQLVICSEQIMDMPTAFSWISTLNDRPQMTNVNLKLWHMLKSFCNGLHQLQTRAGFTHRDSHASNVYYRDPSGGRHAKITFIDFDFSSIRHGNTKICVPQALYDTSRESYTQNKSVDMCIFLFTVNGTISKTLAARGQKFIAHILTPLMTQYQIEVKKELLKTERPFREAKLAHKTSPEDQELKRRFIIAKRKKYAALDILSLCTGNGGRFSLFNGIRNLPKEKQLEFPYLMGFFEWKSMTPLSVMKLLDQNYNLMKE